MTSKLQRLKSKRVSENDISIKIFDKMNTVESVNSMKKSINTTSSDNEDVDDEKPAKSITK